MTPDLSGFAEPIVTLVAAFAGAWFAFLFERRSKQREEVIQRNSAANRALYTIFNIWNVQEQLRKEIIEPHRGRWDAWLNMPTTVPSHYGMTTFDAYELSFVMDMDAGLYGELMLEEQRFHDAMRLVEQRSNIILTEVFPRLADAGIGINEVHDSGEIERALGASIVRKLNVLTEGITTNVDENLGTLVATYEKLRATLKRQHPDQKFLRVEFRLDNS